MTDVRRHYQSVRDAAAQDITDGYVTKVLDRTVANGASLLVAMELREPTTVVNALVDTFWNELRDFLRDEDRLHAIALLLMDRINPAAEQLLNLDIPGEPA